MMTRDVMVRLVCEMHEAVDKISKAEGALDDYENGSSFMSDQAVELLRKQVVVMKTYHDIVAARISHQTRGATYGTEF